MPRPSNGSCCRTHDGSPRASCTFCMRLWDWKGVRVGECKAGRFHLLIFLPESSVNTPATRHHSPKLVRGGLREHTPMPRLPSWPRPRREGQDAGLLLGRDWAGALTLCPLPLPSWGPRQWFRCPPLVGWGEQRQKPTQGPRCVMGACPWDRAARLGRLRLGRDGQPAGRTENQKEARSSVACRRQVLGWVREEWDLGHRMGDL